jgi:AcrR family transcriptional regulator
MENAIRSERTRKAVIEAALAIIARDGPGRLTMDAIARESGISKGGVTHQFRTKEAVLKALLDHQIEYFGKIFQDHLAAAGSTQAEAHLSAQIATLREAAARQHAVAFAVVGALAEAPDLLSATRENDAKTIERIKADAADPELAVLRWAAAQGLALSAVFGICPLSSEERERLFDRLLDDRQWTALSKADI